MGQHRQEAGTAQRVRWGGPAWAAQQQPGAGQQPCWVHRAAACMHDPHTHLTPQQRRGWARDHSSGGGVPPAVRHQSLTMLPAHSRRPAHTGDASTTSTGNNKADATSQPPSELFRSGELSFGTFGDEPAAEVSGE